MAQGTIGLRFNIDTSQAKTQVSDLSRTIADLNEKIREATEAGDWGKHGGLFQTLNDTASARGSIMQQAKQAQNPQAVENMKNGGIFGGNSNSDFGKYILTQSLTRLTENVISALEKGFTAAKQRAGGDYTGAAVTERQRTGDLIGDAAGIAGGVLGFLGGGPFAAALAGSLSKSIVGFIANIGTHKLEERLAYSQQYKNALPGIDILNQNFGGAINAKSAAENNRFGMELRGRAVNAAQGTGLETDSFIQAMGRTAAYGIRDPGQALSMTRNMALWSRFTGADLGAIQKFSGQAYRYGGETNAASVAYGGLMAQNMGKGQFTEFLNSMERILEEGISKGFVRSAVEIAGNMQMLYKLSGGSALWQGEQGAQRLSQMNMAISNATGLQSVEDVISYSAAKGVWDKIDKTGWQVGKEYDGIIYTDTYADTMQLLEKGLSPYLLKGQWSAVRQLEGDNPAATIERFQTMYGLNYAGASQVWAMYNNAWDAQKGDWKAGFNKEEFTRIVKSYQSNTDYKSDATLLRDTLNGLNHTLVGIGSLNFEEEIRILGETQKNVSDIYLHLTKGVYKNKAQEAISWLQEQRKMGEGSPPRSMLTYNSEWDNIISEAGKIVKEFTSPGSRGGEEFTKEEYGDFLKRLEAIIKAAVSTGFIKLDFTANIFE